MHLVQVWISTLVLQPCWSYCAIAKWPEVPSSGKSKARLVGGKYIFSERKLNWYIFYLQKIEFSHWKSIIMAINLLITVHIEHDGSLIVQRQVKLRLMSISLYLSDYKTTWIAKFQVSFHFQKSITRLLKVTIKFKSVILFYASFRSFGFELCCWWCNRSKSRTTN